MYRENLQSEQRGQLSDLIAFDADGRAVWPAAQLKSALREQLLSGLNNLVADRNLFDAISASTTPPLTNYLDLLRHPRPPLDLLIITKDHAKLAHRDPRSALPPDVALLLYYGSIAAALLRHGRRISRLTDDELRGGFNWAVRQSWVDDETRSLFLKTLRLMRSSLLRWRR